jgi:hypothetical protein
MLATVTVGVNVNVPPEFVMLVPTVTPLLVAAVLVASVIAPVCAVPELCWIERRPVLVMVTAPVEPERLMPVPAVALVTKLVEVAIEYNRPLLEPTKPLVTVLNVGVPCTVSVPVISALPCTESSTVGVELPIPR